MKIIDLSTPIYDEMEVYEGDPQVKIAVFHDYDDKNWQLRELNMGTHTGTHVDAFSHMHPKMASIDDIPIERFFGNAQIVSNIETIPKNIGLFFIEEIGLEMLMKLIECKPGFVGGNITVDLERALLSNEIITYTNLVNLELISKDKTFMFYGLPLRIKDGDGSPVRAIAIIED